MLPETIEWVAKAEADFASMVREASVAESPNRDLVCFLAQQSAEKLGLFCEDGIPFPKTHDLNKLAANSAQDAGEFRVWARNTLAMEP